MSFQGTSAGVTTGDVSSTAAALASAEAAVECAQEIEAAARSIEEATHSPWSAGEKFIGWGRILQASRILNDAVFCRPNFLWRAFPPGPPCERSVGTCHETIVQHVIVGYERLSCSGGVS